MLKKSDRVQGEGKSRYIQDLSSLDLSPQDSPLIPSTALSLPSGYFPCILTKHLSPAHAIQYTWTSFLNIKPCLVGWSILKTSPRHQNTLRDDLVHLCFADTPSLPPTSQPATSLSLGTGKQPDLPLLLLHPVHHPHQQQQGGWLHCHSHCP